MWIWTNLDLGFYLLLCGVRLKEVNDADRKLVSIRVHPNKQTVVHDTLHGVSQNKQCLTRMHPSQGYYPLRLPD